MFEDFIEVELPGSVDGILSTLEQIQSIVLIDKTIRKHSQNFMEPKSGWMILSLDSFLLWHAYSEVNSCEISQVEQVVWFGWSWQEFLHRCFKDLQGRVKYFGLGFEDISIESSNSEMPLQNGWENSIQCFLFKSSQGYQDQMS